MNIKEQILRSDLNQAIYDLSSITTDTKEIKKLRAYIKRKIKELKELEVDDFLDKEQTDFLIERGFKIR